MKGHIRKRKNWWVIDWYDPAIKRNREISWYRGLRMYDRRLAEKLLAEMQGEFERGVFRIERYLGKGSWTDVTAFFEEWLDTKEKKKPATIKGYRSYYRNWIKPFFDQNTVMLHEVNLSVLDRLLDSIKLTGKGKLNVMMCFHAFVEYAWRSGKIQQMPPFPKREDYGIVEPTISWLPEKRQMAIIKAIPDSNRPIFLWLKYHLRRPSEACALQWRDYDEINSVFIVRRSISSRQIIESTKTNAEHIIPCHDDFLEEMKKLIKKREESWSPNDFIFKNPLARKKGKRYTNESLNRLWKKACDKVNEHIDLYSGLKHSSCSQYINEKGLSISDLQVITDHARLDSVKKYAVVGLDRKRELMRRKNIFKLASANHLRRQSNDE